MRSQRLLAELQERAAAAAPRVVVLVEGLSDCFAVEAAAAVEGRDLEDEGVAVVPMGGATNLGRFVAEFGTDAHLAGLCDRGEVGFMSRTLERAGVIEHADRASMEATGFFVCERDLEDELIRAVGVRGVEEIIEREGELESLRRLQQMPFHRGRAAEAQLHRFMGARSGRKYRYAPLLVAALEPGRLPKPLRDLLSTLRRSRAATEWAGQRGETTANQSSPSPVEAMQMRSLSPEVPVRYMVLVLNCWRSVTVKSSPVCVFAASLQARLGGVLRLRRLGDDRHHAEAHEREDDPGQHRDDPADRRHLEPGRPRPGWWLRSPPRLRLPSWRGSPSGLWRPGGRRRPWLGGRAPLRRGSRGRRRWERRCTVGHTDPVGRHDRPLRSRCVRAEGVP